MYKASNPIAVLLKPVELLYKDMWPNAVLLLAVFKYKDASPTAVFWYPVELLYKAFVPSAVL